VCATSEAGKAYSALADANAKALPAFFCDATPPGEPTCTPKRPKAVDGSTIYDGTIKADDSDGDGIANSADNCPTVFNPIRPLDHGAQADSDGDGIGDACDPCPLDKAAMTCAKLDPYDVDGDGVPDFADNCPALANPDQADADSDFKGDACDACPAIANANEVPCPYTIHDLRTKPELQNTLVAVKNALVTAVVYSGTAHKPGGFFIQMKPSDPGYVGPENSGIFVYGTPPATVKVGTRVDIPTAQLTTYFGEFELGFVTVVVPNPTAQEADPDPIAVSVADVATGGPRAAALEGVLVRISDVTVSDIAPAPGPGDTAPTNEYVVDGKLRVDDLAAAVSPALPSVGTNYGTITGVLAYRNNNSKIGPRGPADITTGRAALASLGPAATFTRVGSVDAPTLSPTTPLTVTLSAKVMADTAVMLASSDPASLTVPAMVVVPSGSDSVVVPVSGIARAASVTITATLGTISKPATVRVLDDSDVPAIASLTPPQVAVQAGGSATLTVTLDLPAPAAGAEVTLTTTSWTTSAPSVTVPGGAFAATFTVTQANAATDTVTATLGASTASSQLSVAVAGGHPVINEVNYADPAADGGQSKEFIEIYNPSDDAIDLTGFAAVAATNTQGVYLTWPLSGTLLGKGFLVIGSQNVTVPDGVTKITFNFGGNSVLKDSDPTAFAIIDTAKQTIIDAVSLGTTTSVTAKPAGFANPISFLEGTFKALRDSTANAGRGSCVRVNEGQDTNNLSDDWTFLAVLPTPGAKNQ
jgi:hypothetical protein